MGSLRNHKLLYHIFVDKVHIVIIDISYYKKLNQVKGLHRYGYPMITLIATLLGVIVPWFETSLLIYKSVTM